MQDTEKQMQCLKGLREMVFYFARRLLQCVKNYASVDGYKDQVR